MAPYANWYMHVHSTEQVRIELPVGVASAEGTRGDGCFRRYDMFGASQGQVCAKNGRLSLVVSGAPVYLVASS